MKRLLFLLVTMTACMAAWAAEGYAVYTQSNHTLTFYYGTKPSGAFGLNSGINYPEWYNYGTYAAVERVVFDPSFAQARPTTTAYWFYEMENLTNITGLNYLNTSEVTNMLGMFWDCKYLTSLDLSSFNTANVTDMRFMFNKCENLTSLDVSSFNTANVINMLAMFWDCKNLTSLDVSSFNTSNVTDMAAMFENCGKLTSLDLSGFNTANVTDMGFMFNKCENLTSLDLSSFNTANVTNMKNMFENCDELKTITVGSTWSTEAVTSSTDMFTNCFKIEGGAGTTFSSSHTDASYAHIDGGTSNPGYLTGATYDLWINGVQVTCANQNGVTGPGISGSVTYDASINTLTLNNATIDRRGLSVCAIENAYGGPTNLKIKLVGDNKILANTNNIAINAKESQGFTLYGSGTLDCGGALYLDAHDHLTNDATVSYIKDCSVYFDNILSEGYEECLTIDNADVTTEYLSVGSDHNGYKGLNLVNCYVASPANGVVSNYGYITVNGGEWQGHIEIKRSAIAGDVNGDGTVTAADITALYDVLLNNDYSHVVNGDQTGDNIITAADITAVYGVLLSN
jgi:surface protein